jgi:hypothetical protein
MGVSVLSALVFLFESEDIQIKKVFEGIKHF